LELKQTWPCARQSEQSSHLHGAFSTAAAAQRFDTERDRWSVFITAVPYHQPEWSANRMASRADTFALRKTLAVRQVTTFEGFRVLVIIGARRRQGHVGIPVGPNPIKYEQTDC